MEDPLLSGKKEISTKEPIVQNVLPRSFKEIPAEYFFVASQYLQLIWNLKKDGGKVVEAQLLLENTKFLFSDEMRYKDGQWMEHAATNLRELFELKFTDIRKAIRGIPPDEDTPGKTLSFILITATNYLNNVVHLRPSAAQENAKDILSADELKGASTQEVFEKIVILLLYRTYQFFCFYAYTPNE